MQWQLDVVVGKHQGKQPLRQLLERTWLLPHRFVHYLRIRQNVLVNGQYYSMNQMVAVGDRIQLTFLGDEFRTPTSNYIPNRSPQLSILYENRDLLVVNKPAGQKTHPNQKGETGTLMNEVAGYLQKQPQAAAYMVHRIDQATSGAVIVAKNPVVVPILDRQISIGKIHRAYLAVVEGQFDQSQGQFTWPIGRDLTDKRKRQVNGPGAQTALTYYQVVGTNGQQSLVHLTLGTGRTHQLRVHLAYSGHPIIGDPLYNPVQGGQLLLHGITQKLVLPFSNQVCEIQAPIPTAFPHNLVKLWQSD